MDEIDAPDADDPSHRHYSSIASAAIPPGGGLRCGLWRKGLRIKSAVRRSNLTLRVCRTAFLEPIGKARDDSYEQRLLFGLPWHCPKRPATSRKRGQPEVTWTFATHAPNTPCELQSFEVTNGVLADNGSYEQLCIQYEHAYADFACECCIDLVEAGTAAQHAPGPCRSSSPMSSTR